MKPTDGFCERQTVSGFIVAVLYSGHQTAIYDKPLFDAPFVTLKESALPL